MRARQGIRPARGVERATGPYRGLIRHAGRRGAALVSGRLELSRRRDNLSWSCHAGVTTSRGARWVSQRIEFWRRRQNLAWSQAARVARAVPLCSRLQNLSWSHHSEVAAWVSGRVEVYRRRETLSWSRAAVVTPAGQVAEAVPLSSRLDTRDPRQETRSMELSLSRARACA